jgi:hypothetical protein
MLTPASPLTDHQALTDFHALLRDACQDRPPSRPQSVLYQSCRATLMEGNLKAFLPGFVRQCMSIERFREFIHLYDRDPQVRIAFLDGELAAAWAHAGAPRVERSSPPSPPPAPALLDEDDGFMDDPAGADEAEEPRPAGAFEPREIGFRSEAPPLEARMRSVQ